MKPRGIGTWLSVILAAVVAFFYRYLTLEFTNDHFVHLSRAFQIVEGEVPLRDFFDPGLFLPAQKATLLARGIVRKALVVAAMITAWSVGTNADGMTSLVNSGLLNGPSGVGNRLAFVTERLRSRPIDNWTRRSRGIGGLTRYVNVCTTSADLKPTRTYDLFDLPCYR